MAFLFESRWQNRAFFPTVPIHDGLVHRMEEFDHDLYLQNDLVSGQLVNGRLWQKSVGEAGKYVQSAKSVGIVLAEATYSGTKMSGRLPNQDVLVPTAPPAPPKAAEAVLEDTPNPFG